MAEKEDSFFKNLKSNIPLIYIFLVCFGYFNMSIYYDRFGINILNYLSIQELVLIFIPFGSVLLTVAFIFFLMLAPFVVFGPKISDEEAEKDHFNLVPLIDNVKNNSLRKFLRNLYWIIAMLSSIYLYFAFPLLLVYYAIVINFDLQIESRVPVLIIILWGFTFSLKYKFHSTIPKNNLRLTSFVYLVWAMVIFIVFSDIRIRNAQSILNGNSRHYVKFTLGEKVIETGDELHYFGETNDFIFLRNTESGGNHIYSRSEISEFVFKVKEE